MEGIKLRPEVNGGPIINKNLNTMTKEEKKQLEKFENGNDAGVFASPDAYAHFCMTGEATEGMIDQEYLELKRKKDKKRSNRQNGKRGR